MVHLSTKDTSEHSGIESFVLQKYNAFDISWIPRQKALCLQSVKTDEDDEDEEGDTNEKHEQLMAEMSIWHQKILSIQSDLEKLLDSIEKKEEEE